jgi:hypothetical protein
MKSIPSIGITGTSSGFGKYLLSELDASPINRTNFWEGSSYDVIIHCAYPKAYKNPPLSGLEYLEGTTILTKKLLEKYITSHFIFISSIEVVNWTDPMSKTMLYTHTKAICEEMVSKHPSYSIIRPSQMCWSGAGNTMSKILSRQPIDMTYDSEINPVLYSDTLDVINSILNGNREQKLYYVKSKDSISIGTLSYLYNFEIKNVYSYTLPIDLPKEGIRQCIDTIVLLEERTTKYGI